MPRPSPALSRERLRTSFALDELWRTTTGLPEGDTKERALQLLIKVLSTRKTPYAIIGGVAVQLYSREPRTTRDIDIALASCADIPRAALTEAGFKRERRFEHSENWRAPGKQARRLRTAIRFSVDKLTPGTVERAETLRVRSLRLRVAALPDLVRLKLAAAEEPAPRPSQRQSDVADVIRLLEEHPELQRQVPDAKPRVARIARQVASSLDALIADEDE
jgi:hypothetical protein